MSVIRPQVRNQYIIKEIDVIITIMAYRTLTEREILTAVAMYSRTIKKWPPKKGTRITFISPLGSR